MESAIEWGVFQKAYSGQEVCGDQYLVLENENGCLLAVVDGIGHGPKATQAAELALDTLRESAGRSIHHQFETCHRALRSTRGVVMTVVEFNVREDIMTWMGVGNVDGVLFRSAPDVFPASEHILLRGGVVGALLPSLYAGSLHLSRGDLLVLATDGIRSSFDECLPVNNPPQDIADEVFEKYFRGTDDALVLVARYRGGQA